MLYANGYPVGGGGSGASTEIIADDFDATSTYAVGDYCIYDGSLYKCTTAVPTAGQWDSTKWTETLVMDEVEQGGGTGGHTIIDENGTSMTARAGLQFVGGANVSDDGTNNKTIVDLASAGGIDGVFVDTDNVIQATTQISTSGLEYTATEDCIVYIYLWGGNSTAIKINDSYVAGNFSNDKDVYLIPLKKGQTLTTTSGNARNTYTVYGIQTGTTYSKFQPVIYSTEEREIGVWTDGKPLYEKTFTKTVAADSDETLITGGIDHAHMVTSYYANATESISMAYNQGSINANCYIQVINNNLILHNMYSQSLTWTVVVQYTKTTDVAGSGSWTPQGVPTHHYSTDEQVIGTWVDGSTLYEKTINSTVALSNSWTDYFDMSNKNLVDVSKIRVKRDGEWASATFSPYQIVSYIVRNNYLKFCIQSTSTPDPYVLYSVTIQYTKSS